MNLSVLLTSGDPAAITDYQVQEQLSVLPIDSEVKQPFTPVI